ncbi:putative Regulatory protein GemA [Azospirillaceae bacterium]
MMRKKTEEAPKHAATPEALKRLRTQAQAARAKVSGLSADDVWRDRLERDFGVRSMKMLTTAQLKTLKRALEREQVGEGKRKVRYAETPQLRLIMTMWAEGAKAGWIRDGRWDAMYRFIEAVTGQEMGRLTVSHGRKTIEALKAMEARFRAGSAS